MSKMYYEKTILVNGRKTCPYTKSKIHDSDCVLVVCSSEVDSLINILSQTPEFNDQKAAAFHDFLQNPDSNDTANPIPNLFFELEEPANDLLAFAKNLSTGGVTSLGVAILEKWLPSGVDNIFFSPLKCPVHS